MTRYADGSIELWLKRQVRNSTVEETVAMLSEYEASVLKIILY